MSGKVTVDLTTNMVWIDLRPGALIDRTEKVGASLLADYDDNDELVCVEILSIQALGRPEVLRELCGLLEGPV